MSNEQLRADATMMMEALSEQMAGIADIQRRRTQLTATVTACDKRISVTVNADGMLIETKFADDIKDLTYDEIATAVTESVQAAGRQVQAQARELMEPLQQRKSRLPRLSEILDEAPDLGHMMPVAPPVSTAPPHASERARDDDASEMTYGDVESPRPSRSIVNDTDR